MGHKLKEKTSVLVIGALGVVFGDIGTSPLYTIKICFIGPHALSPSPENIMGVLSMIFWSLNLVVSIKYALFIMRADDGGQGGIFAMLALLHKKLGSNLGRGLVLGGLFGSALLYGDGLITPVISVLSALEGLEVATSQARCTDRMRFTCSVPSEQVYPVTRRDAVCEIPHLRNSFKNDCFSLTVGTALPR